MPLRCSRAESTCCSRSRGPSPWPTIAGSRPRPPGGPGQVVRVAYHRRHDPGFCDVARVVRSGEIGEPFAVQLTSREDFPPSADDGPAGGFIMDVGVHDFDTARWLLQKDPDTAYTLAQNPVFRDDELDNAHITVAHGGGVATIHLSRTSTLGMEIRCEVIGPDGSVVLAQAGTGAGVTVRSSAAAPGFPADCRDRFAAAYQAQMDGFGGACRGEVTANATLLDDRWAVATAVAARASAGRHEPLRIGTRLGVGAPSPGRGLTCICGRVATATCGW